MSMSAPYLLQGKDNGKMRWLRKHFSTIILVMVLFIGLGLVAYPTVSDMWNSHYQSRAMAGFTESVAAISEEDYSRLLEDARKYNGRLYGHQQNVVDDDDGYLSYMGLLNPAGNGIMGRIEIPSIDVSLPIYHGTDADVLQVAVGHLYGSSLPVGGTGTHACLSGHTGLPSAKLFTDLTELSEGDLFVLTILNETLTYQVDQIKIVLPEESEDLAIDPDRDLCTLITCTPYGVNSHRLLVRGTRVENRTQDDVPENGDETAPGDDVQAESVIPGWVQYLAYSYGISLMVCPVLLIIMVTYRAVARRKENDS